MSKSLKAGIVAHSSGKFASIIQGLIIPPLYLSILGSGRYGLFSFLALLNGNLRLLELGFSRAISHDFASSGFDKSAIKNMRTSLRTIEVLVISIGFFLLLLLNIFTSFIVNEWLKVDYNDASLIIKIISIIIFFRWIAIFYRAAVIGMEKHVFINVVELLQIFISSGLGLIVLYKSPFGLLGLLFCYLLSSVLEVFIYCFSLWHLLGGFWRTSFSFDKLKDLGSFALRVASVALPGVALVQADKIVASTFLEIEYFGWYMLVARIATTIIILVNPIYQVAYPRFVSLLANKKEKIFRELYIKLTQFSAFMLFPISVTLAVFSHPVLLVYTRNEILADKMWIIFSVLIIAKILHASGMIPYAVQLAYKQLKYAFWINISALLMIFLLMPILSKKLDMLGLAISWLSVTILYVTVGMYIVHNRFFSGGYGRWLFKDNLPAIFVSLFIGIMIKIIFSPSSDLSGMVLVSVSGLLSLVLSALVLSKVRNNILSMLKRMRA